MGESLPIDRVCLCVFILVRSPGTQPRRPEPYGIVWGDVLNLGTVVLNECSRPDDNGHRPVVQARCNHGNKKCRGIYQAIGKNPLLWASLITAAIGASFAIGLYLDDASARFLIRWTLSGTLVGSIVSLQLGRMVSYSFMHRYLKNEAIEIVSHPGHPDGLGGIKPLEDYFFFHAILFAIPLLHLGAWSILIPDRDGGVYLVWRIAYALLLFVSFVLFLVCSIWPIWSLHDAMKRRKTTLLANNEPMSLSIRELQQKIESTADILEKNQLSENLLVMTRHYYQIQSMPTWPFNLKTLQSFAFKLPLGPLGPLAGSNGSVEFLK